MELAFRSKWATGTRMVRVVVCCCAADVEKELGIVVLDPTTVTFKIAEAVIDVGIRHCKRGLYATLTENAQTRDVC